MNNNLNDTLVNEMRTTILIIGSDKIIGPHECVVNKLNLPGKECDFIEIFYYHYEGNVSKLYYKKKELLNTELERMRVQ